MQSNECPDNHGLSRDPQLDSFGAAPYSSFLFGNRRWNVDPVMHRENTVRWSASIDQRPADAVVDGQMSVQLRQQARGHSIDPTTFVIVELGEDSEFWETPFQLQGMVIEINGSIPRDQSFDAPSSQEMFESINPRLSRNPIA